MQITLVQIRQNKGPSIDPCGTLALTPAQEEISGAVVHGIHQNSKKMATFSEDFLVEITLRLFLLYRQVIKQVGWYR